jgi:hypothetical protein
MLSDFIDCLILASAITCCDTLVTEDNDIIKLRRNEAYKTFYTQKNQKFTIKTLTETI